MHCLCSFICELRLSRFHKCRSPSAAPIPCLPPAPSRPFVVLRLPTSSANERPLAPACSEALSTLGGWDVRPSCLFFDDFITVGLRWPRPLKPDASRAMHARLVASRVRLGSQQWPFSASRAWCAARLASARPHTHTHMERNPGRQDFTTNTRTHTPHTGTHAHARTQSLAHTHAHAHTQG